MYWLIWDALQDLIPFVKFKKLEKHLWKSVTFSKIAGESLAKIITLPWMFFMFFKLCKCYEIAQSFLYTYETLFTLKMFYYLVQTVWWKLEIGNMNLVWAYFEQSTLLCWNMSLHSKFSSRMFGRAICDKLPECIFQNFQKSRRWFIPKIARTKRDYWLITPNQQTLRVETNIF